MDAMRTYGNKMHDQIVSPVSQRNLVMSAVFKHTRPILRRHVHGAVQRTAVTQHDGSAAHRMRQRQKAILQSNLRLQQTRLKSLTLRIASQVERTRAARKEQSCSLRYHERFHPAAAQAFGHLRKRGRLPTTRATCEGDAKDGAAGSRLAVRDKLRRR